MHVVDYSILGAWIVFWVYWLSQAARAKRGSARWGRFAGVRVLFVLLVLVLVRAGVLRSTSATDDPALWAVGLVLFVGGLALAVWARRYLGTNWGMPMSQKDDAELVTTGPYAKIRHPIYAGLLLALLGTAVAVGWYWLVAFGVLGAYFVYSATVEERDMAKRFPEAYPAYRQETKMLVPYVF